MASKGEATRGTGLLIQSGKPLPSTTKRSFLGASDLDEWGAGPKNGAVLFYVVLAEGWLGRIVDAWRLLLTGEVRVRVDSRIALDLARRLTQSSAYADTGEDEPGEPGDD